MTLLLGTLIPHIVWEDPHSSDAVQDPSLSNPQKGILRIEDFELQCYRDSTGEISFDLEDVERFFRGCPLCDHPSHCPECNPSVVERNCHRLGLLVSEE